MLVALPLLGVTLLFLVPAWISAAVASRLVLQPPVQEMLAQRDVPGLLSALGTWHRQDVRAAAALGLGELGHARDAALALGRAGDPGAVEPLVSLLWVSDLPLRREIVTVLGMLGWQPESEELTALGCVARGEWDECAGMGAPAIRPLTAALADPDEAVRARARSTLLRIGPDAVEPLAAALTDPQAAVRESVALVLGRIGDARAVPPLLRALDDTDRDVRRLSAWALGCLRDRQAVEPLIAALGDGDPFVRTAVVAALGRLGDARAARALYGALDDPAPSVREGVRSALAQIEAGAQPIP